MQERNIVVTTQEFVRRMFRRNPFRMYVYGSVALILIFRFIGYLLDAPFIYYAGVAIALAFSIWGVIKHFRSGA